MSLNKSVLAVNDDIPIRTLGPVHSGKVRSVYWLTPEDSHRLIEQKGYDVATDALLAVMIISDRISAFDCIWHGEDDLRGVPGKGVALNAISNHWFSLFKDNGLADSHILDIPHPLVWIVQKASPVKIEAICRQYITGSMWRAYSQGERDFCGIKLENDLQKNQKLKQLLMTPSTKGVLVGIPGIPEADDVNITRDDIQKNFAAFNFSKIEDIARYEHLLNQGFEVISDALAKVDQIFVDTKFEFGYVIDKKGQQQLIYMDEVGTPDSSRIWDGASFANGIVIEKSKEAFRQQLLSYFTDPDILLNKDRMIERASLAKENALPIEMLMDVSKTYLAIAATIIGKELTLPKNPRAEIIDVLNSQYNLII